MKYVVMETALSYAVVMDEKGRFIKVPNLNYEVGETLDSVYIAKKERSKSFMFGRKIRGWVAVAACLAVLVLGGIHLWNDPVSTVLIEINPSVLIEINRFDRVINVKGLNYDGEQLLSGYERKSSTAGDVAAEIASVAKQKGYFEGGGQIRISADENEPRIIAHLKAYFNDEVTVISGKEEWKTEEIPSSSEIIDNETELPLEDAVSIAFKDLGISDAVCVKSEFDSEDGVYEIEFVSGNTEYEYSIDPTTGKILEATSEPVDYDD